MRADHCVSDGEYSAHGMVKWGIRKGNEKCFIQFQPARPY